MAQCLIASCQSGGEVQFDSFVGYYGNACFAEGDASTLSEHTVYYSTWDTGTGSLRRPTTGAVARCKNLLRRSGHGRLLMEVFARASILTALATSAGWPCCKPIDIIHDGIDLTLESGRRIVDQRISEEDPFCIVFPFPCGPWNSLTEFNAARYPHIRERTDDLREEHMPMLRWVVRRARDRIRLGRIALIENPATSRALKLDFFEELDGLDDGMVAEAVFAYVIGDQCMLGQCDRETKELFRGRTKWGTNSDRLKHILSTMCDGGHSHQQIMGGNKFGARSAQKAEWPLEMCRHILRGIVEELRDRIALRVHPAEMVRESAEGRGRSTVLMHPCRRGTHLAMHLGLRGTPVRSTSRNQSVRPSDQSYPIQQSTSKNCSTA